MSYDWVPNIRCEIADGKALLAPADKEGTDCSGFCSDCDSFLGVDIRTIGAFPLSACCADRRNGKGSRTPRIYQ